MYLDTIAAVTSQLDLHRDVKMRNTMKEKQNQPLKISKYIFFRKISCRQPELISITYFMWVMFSEIKKQNRNKCLNVVKLFLLFLAADRLLGLCLHFYLHSSFWEHELKKLSWGNPHPLTRKEKGSKDNEWMNWRADKFCNCLINTETEICWITAVQSQFIFTSNTLGQNSPAIFFLHDL